MTAVVTRSTPPQRLITLFNPLVTAVARSPLHPLVDGGLVLLHVVGRRTGRRYDIPVGFTRLDGRYLVVTQHAWRANLRGVTEVAVTHRGRRTPMAVALDEDAESVARTVARVIDRYGRAGARRALGLTVHVDRAPTLDEIADAVRDYAIATITLTPPSGS